MARRSLRSLRLKLQPIVLGGIAIVSLAGCSEANRDRPGRAEKPVAAPVPAPAAPAPVAPVAPTATPVPPAPAPVPPAATPLRAEDAKGISLVQIWLPAKQRMGGFALALAFDARAFALGQPQTAASLAGYLCQPNLATPGQLRFNCVGLPGEPRGGLLASIPVSWRDRPPTVADLRFLQNDVVDDLGAAMAETRLELQVAAPAP